jgi:hypothetical protein
MKRIISIFTVVLVMALYGNAMAASSIVYTPIGQSDKGGFLLIKAVCTAHTDGEFTNTTATQQISSAHVGFEYWKVGYVLAHAWAINSATDDHTNAAIVTITDETGQVIVGAAVGDTLTLSQSASGIAYMVIDRPSSQRAVTSKLTVSIDDTGSTATVQTIYLLLRK